MGMVIAPNPGTYALVLSCTSNIPIQVGRLGTMQLQHGYYVYVASALGPGGLCARIAHHEKPSRGPILGVDRRLCKLLAEVQQRLPQLAARLQPFGA